MEREMSLNELFNDDLLSIIDIGFRELCKNDKDFLNLHNQRKNIVTNNKNIDAVCYEKEVIPLNAEDVKDLIKWLDYKDELDLKYEKKMIYMGIRIAYMMFNNAGLLKTEL